MSLVINGKTITQNKIISAIIMSIGLVGISAVSVIIMVLLGEAIAYIFPQWFQRGLFIQNMNGMFAGAVTGLLAFVILFGRKGSSFSINTHEKRSTEYAGERKDG